MVLFFSLNPYLNLNRLSAFAKGFGETSPKLKKRRRANAIAQTGFLALALTDYYRPFNYPAELNI